MSCGCLASKSWGSSRGRGHRRAGHPCDPEDDTPGHSLRWDVQHIVSFVLRLVIFAVGGVLLVLSVPAGLRVVALGTIVELIGAVISRGWRWWRFCVEKRTTAGSSRRPAPRFYLAFRTAATSTPAVPKNLLLLGSLTVLMPRSASNSSCFCGKPGKGRGWCGQN